MRRRRPTLRQLDDLEDKLALERENADRFRKMWVLLEGVRGRYNDVLCRAVLKRAGAPKVDLDDVDYAVVVGGIEAVKGRYRTVNLDGEDLGRGSGPIFHVLRVGKMSYPIVRRPS